MISPASGTLVSSAVPHLDPSASESIKAQTIHRKSSFTGTHSFDVLRSDPTTFSLEHIASSKTLQSRGPNATKPATPTGIANGSAPAFRVVLPTATSQPMYTDTHLNATPDRSFPGAAHPTDGRPIPAMANTGSVEPTSVFSFSDGSHVTKMIIDDEIRSRFHEVGDRGASFRVEGRGKKHQCPQCPKRFNRPSSLRIHVNTHTGARRMYNFVSSLVAWNLNPDACLSSAFRCPYPNCGREFNVNSNMRRHYRNHSIAATAEVHPPRHNSGRRPRGYLRPHPGHTPTTVFHISAGQSPRTTLSSASFTDDDFDMRQISDDGEDSSFEDDDDDDDENHDEDEEEMRSTHYKSSSWSLRPVVSPDHSYAHSYQYSLSSAHTSSSFVTRYSEFSPSVSQRIGRIVSPTCVQGCKDAKVSTTLRPAFR